MDTATSLHRSFEGFEGRRRWKFSDIYCYMDVAEKLILSKRQIKSLTDPKAF